MIRKAKLKDAVEIAKIYNYYVRNSVVTFEEAPIEPEEMKERIQAVVSKFPWLVYVKEGKIIGYAYAIEWKSRSAYKLTVETAIYLKQGVTEKGTGSLLYKELIRQLIEMNIHAIIGGVSLPNKVSVGLHEKLGFKKVAHFKEVGYKFNKWIDVGYWELIIDTTNEQ
jgi:phosphinothricin acetyltransferase